MNYILSLTPENITPEELTMSLLDTADVLRCIFSTVLAIGDCKTYRSIRLACKRLKSVLDTLSVEPLLLSITSPRSRGVQFANSRYLANYRHILADGIAFRTLFFAPKQVLRAYFLIEPTHKLHGLEYDGYESFTLLPDPENKLFRQYFRSSTAASHSEMLYGCRVAYIDDYFGMELLKRLQDCLNSDEAVRLIYKSAVVELLRKKAQVCTNSVSISRELFGAIGALLPFTPEELEMKVDLKTRAFLEDLDTLPYDDKGLDRTKILRIEEDPNDGLYLDEDRQTFRYHNTVLDRKNKNPRYWSEATLETWIERLC